MKKHLNETVVNEEDQNNVVGEEKVENTTETTTALSDRNIVKEDKKIKENKVKKETTKEKREFKTEDINNWKKDFKKIYKTQIGDNIFIWRKLRRHEYASIKSQTYEDVVTPTMANIMMEEDFVKTCVLYPFSDEINEIIEDNAGIASSLSDIIMDRSGFTIRTQAQEL